MGRSVRILGAGPAGLAAAISLARAGFEVEVFERRHDCGARFRGDLQGLENWSRPTDALEDLRRFRITPTFDHHPFTEVLQANRERTDRIALRRPGFYLLRRGVASSTLDQALKEQAVGLGVTIHFRTIVSPHEADIVASGPRSNRISAVAKGLTFKTENGSLAVGYFDPIVSPGGYSYLLTTGGLGCLAVVLFRDFPRAGQALRMARERLLGRFQISCSEPRGFGGVGQFSLRPRYREGRTLYVGEAAGLQDLLWGFGIRTAIESGVLAARCIESGRDYRKLARRAFGHRQRAGLVNRFVWALLCRGEHGLLMRLIRDYDTRLLRSMYNYNPLQALLFPIARAWYALHRRLG